MVSDSNLLDFSEKHIGKLISFLNGYSYKEINYLIEEICLNYENLEDLNTEEILYESDFQYLYLASIILHQTPDNFESDEKKSEDIKSWIYLLIRKIYFYEFFKDIYFKYDIETNKFKSQYFQKIKSLNNIKIEFFIENNIKKIRIHSKNHKFN